MSPVAELTAAGWSETAAAELTEIGETCQVETSEAGTLTRGAPPADHVRGGSA